MPIQKQYYEYFNPRSDERSDDVSISNDNDNVISIHAPTNGATCSFSQNSLNDGYFNPRSDERSDHR